MKLTAGPSAEEQFAAMKQWHRWFAWYPVRVGPREERWWEWVERRGSWTPVEMDWSGYCQTGGWEYEYRATRSLATTA